MRQLHNIDAMLARPAFVGAVGFACSGPEDGPKPEPDEDVPPAEDPPFRHIPNRDEPDWRHVPARPEPDFRHIPGFQTPDRG